MNGTVRRRFSRSRCCQPAGGACATTAAPPSSRRPETISYSALAERVYAAAIDLADLPPGVPVGVSISREVEHLVVTMALLALGIPSVVFPSHESAGNIAAIAAALGVSHYAGDRRADLPHNLIPVPVRFGGRKGTQPCWRVLEAGDDAIFRTTSGTTGRPKIFSLSGLRLWLMARNAAGDAEQRRVLRTSSVEYDSSRLSRCRPFWRGTPAFWFPTCRQKASFPIAPVTR